MSRIGEYLESLTWGRQILQKGGTGIKAGQAWSYPLKLEKGVDYLIKTKGGKNVKSMTCVLTNGYEPPTLHKVSGRAPSFSFVPETDGVYRLHVSLDSTDNLAPGAVEVTVLRERARSRLLTGMAGWPGPAMPQGV